MVDPFQIVTERMPNGEALRYAQEHQDADRVILVSSPPPIPERWILIPSHDTVDRCRQRAGSPTFTRGNPRKLETGQLSQLRTFPSGSHDMFKAKHPCGFRRPRPSLGYRVFQACTHWRIGVRLGQCRPQRLPMGGTRDFSERQTLQTIRRIHLWVRRRRGAPSLPLSYTTITDPAQIFTGDLIWEGDNATEVRSKLLACKRPRSPEGEKKRALTADLWRIFTRCWAKQPDGRILVSRVLELLQYLWVLNSPG